MDSNLKDYLTFKKMITPMVIQIAFWIWVVFIIIGGLGMMFTVSFFWWTWHDFIWPNFG